jgi:hypothetical protein
MAEYRSYRRNFDAIRQLITVIMTISGSWWFYLLAYKISSVDEAVSHYVMLYSALYTKEILCLIIQ